jgi:hypothetical protein
MIGRLGTGLDLLPHARSERERADRETPLELRMQNGYT